MLPIILNAKIFPAAILATLTSILPLPALAAPELSEEDQHRELVSALHSVGVRTGINVEGPCDPENNAAGTYTPATVTLVVCQDHSTEQNGEPVHWTANDLDTLRHESMHVVQDCVSGGLGDSRASVFFEKDDLIRLMKESSIPMDSFERIWNSYEKNGLEVEDIVMEMEAFMVAADVSASTLAGVILKVCEPPNTFGM